MFLAVLPTIMDTFRFLLTAFDAAFPLAPAPQFATCRSSFLSKAVSHYLVELLALRGPALEPARMHFAKVLAVVLILFLSLGEFAARLPMLIYKRTLAWQRIVEFHFAAEANADRRLLELLRIAL